MLSQRMRGIGDMPKKADPSLRQGENEDGRYLSQIAASERWNEKMQQIVIRVPGGARDQINEYVKRKAEEHSDVTDSEYWRYRSTRGTRREDYSVTAFIIHLLEEEMGVSLDTRERVVIDTDNKK